jgi:L,D-peptidoglycan transpeptidase YkuD (ErfK/YbiS/YcfS/YnhG family)
MIFAAFAVGQSECRRQGEVVWQGHRVKAALGKGGLTPAAEKREGDGAGPIGVWPLRRVLYRPDKAPPPKTALSLEPIHPQDGWCDAPLDPAYNRPVTLPYPASAERMWRDDGLYDLVVVLGHNDDPVVPGAGSAIFLHLAKPDYSPTEGCVALARPDLEALLAAAAPGDVLEIKSSAA